MISYLLPLFIAGVIHFWNPGGSTKGIRFESPEKTITFDLRGFSEATIQSDETNVVGKITETWKAANDSTSVRVWVDVAGAPIDGKAAKDRWVIPSDPYTGILLATDEATELEIVLYKHDGSSVRMSAGASGHRSMAFYTSWLFYGESDGTVVITSKGAPIFAAAARCTPACSPVPVQ